MSNYYHLTYDMLLPLYVQWYHNRNTKNESNQMVFLPTVETRRLQVLDWETPAFENMTKYWADMTKFIAADSVLMPLDKKFVQSSKTVCFEELYFGTMGVNFTDSNIIEGFVEFVKNQLEIEDVPPKEHRLAFVSRKGRRKILNEEEIVTALKPIMPCDLVEFTDMSFADQVRLMQKYTVFAAVNGAGLMNALYLPKGSVAIQIAPYKSGLNVVQYGKLLKARGPYLEWHNTHQELTKEYPGDKFNNRPDTTVHITEFKYKVREAMKLYDNFLHGEKTEL